MVKKQLVAEKGLKEKMIHSVMPPKVANWLMKGHAEDIDDALPGSTLAPSNGVNGDDSKASKVKALYKSFVNSQSGAALTL